MNTLGLILARSGSKRLPHKNIKALGGLPLIAWTIRSTIQSEVCCDIVVSTDDAEIAEIAQRFGANVYGLRPPELATDTASSVDVALYSLDSYEVTHGAVDALMLLQPTSPFRSPETIRKATSLFEQSGGSAVVGVSAVHSHPAWCFRIDNGYLLPYVEGDSLNTRSQDLPAAYAVNGAMYIVSPQMLRQGRNFFPSATKPLIMENPIESVDIDTHWDWQIADALVKAGVVKVPQG